MVSHAAPSENDELVSFARELAYAARRQTLAPIARDYRIEDKGQGGQYDPVTEVDRTAEQAMRALISTRFPDHEIRGEEFPEKPGTGGYTWSLDPIDGTRSFICGLPTWTTLIALLKDDDPVLGVIDAPRLDETYIGAAGQATIIRGGEASPIRTSSCTRVSEARFSTTDPFLWGPPAASLERILNIVRVTRYGHDGYAYARLAGGTIDLVVESGLKPHDYNALIPVIRAAGGHIGDWRGGTNFSAGQIVAAATPELYHSAICLLADA